MIPFPVRYHQTSNINSALVVDKIVDHSCVLYQGIGCCILNLQMTCLRAWMPHKYTEGGSLRRKHSWFYKRSKCDQLREINIKIIILNQYRISDDIVTGQFRRYVRDQTIIWINDGFSHQSHRSEHTWQTVSHPSFIIDIKYHVIIYNLA